MERRETRIALEWRCRAGHVICPSAKTCRTDQMPEAERLLAWSAETSIVQLVADVQVRRHTANCAPFHSGWPILTAASTRIDLAKTQS